MERLLTILSYYPRRVHPDDEEIKTHLNYLGSPLSISHYDVLTIPSENESDVDASSEEEEEANVEDGDGDEHDDEAHAQPEENAAIDKGAHDPLFITRVVDGVTLTLRTRAAENDDVKEAMNVSDLNDRLRRAQAEASKERCCRLTAVCASMALVAASPTARRVVEASQTDGVVYFAALPTNGCGAPIEPASQHKPSSTENKEGGKKEHVLGDAPIKRHRILSIRVGQIEREQGACYAMKSEYDGYDAPYLGYGQDWRYYQSYRQLSIHSTRLAPGSAAWALLESSAWWWRDRRAVVFNEAGDKVAYASRSVHPICVNAEYLEGDIAFPVELFGRELRVLRIRSYFISHPYCVSSASLDCRVLANAHGARLTELDLYGACLARQLTQTLATGGFPSLVYANLTRTTFSDKIWRDARATMPVRAVVALPALEELILDGCHQLGCLDASVLSHMPNLRKLNVFNCTKLKTIADLAACCPLLVQLFLSYAHLESFSMGNMRMRKKVKAMQVAGMIALNASEASHSHDDGDGKGERDGEAPAPLLYLRFVNMANNNFPLLDWVLHTPALHTLAFSGFDANDTGVPLSSLPAARYLTALTLYCGRVDDLGVLCGCSFLKELVLEGINPVDRPHDEPVWIDLEPLFLAGVTAGDRVPKQSLRNLSISVGGKLRIDYRSDKGEPLVDDSEDAVARSRFTSLLAPPLTTVESFLVEQCDSLDDIHAILTLPNGFDGVDSARNENDGDANEEEEEAMDAMPAPLTTHYASRFPNLKVINVSSTSITDITPILRYCPLLEKMSVRCCRALNLPKILDSLEGLVRNGENAVAAAAASTRRGGSELNSEAASCDANATTRRPDHAVLTSGLPRLRELECDFIGAADDGNTLDDWACRLFCALSLLCPAIETLRTVNVLPVLYAKRDLAKVPVFPELKCFNGALMAGTAKSVRSKGLRNVLPEMFPRIEKMSVGVDSPGQNGVSPFSRLIEMPRLTALELKNGTAFNGTKDVLAHADCPVRVVKCSEPNAALLAMLRGASPRICVLCVSPRWAVLNGDALEALVRSNTSILVQIDKS